MKVLSIGSDKNLLQKGSAVQARMALYGRACDVLHIVIPGAGSEEQIAENVFVHPTGVTNPLKRISAAVAAGKNIKEIDLVTAQDPFEYGLAALTLGKHFNVPVELQVHTDIGSLFFKKEIKNRVRMTGVVRRLARAAGVRVVSDRVLYAVMQLGVPKEHTSVLPMFIDPRRFFDITNTPSEKEKIIFMAGRLEKEKDYVTAFEVFARVHKLIPETRLHIAGDGRLRASLEAQARLHGIANVTAFLGAVEDIAPHLATAHVFLHTSRYEGFGAVVAEAALSGVPIVSTDVGIAGTLLKDGEHLRIAPVGNVDKLTAALLETITRSHKAHERALAASAWMHKNLLPADKYVEKLRSVWQKTVQHS